MIRIAIFDDNPDRRDSLSVLMMTNADLVLCGVFADCNNVLGDVETCKPDVILMDIDMPGVNGIDATQIIKQRWPGINIIIQTVFENEDAIFNRVIF
jgi:DNA-binding NarL/FixJ family response regulator